MIFYIIGSVVVSIILFLVFQASIQNNIHMKFPELKKVKPPSRRPKSPYTITHSTAKDKTLGYSILQDGEHLYIAGTRSYVVYSSYNNVMEDLNRMERQGGYAITPR